MVGSIHKSYTAAYKLTVVARAEIIGNRAAAREFNVDEKCVRRWRIDKSGLEKMPLLKKALRGGIAAWPDLETELESWIKMHRGETLTVLEICTKAKLIAEQMGLKNFKGTVNWCSRFMKRKQLSVKSKAKKLKSQECLSDRKSFFNDTATNFKLSVVTRAEEAGKKAAAQEFDVCECCVDKWQSEKETFEGNIVKYDSEKVWSEQQSLFLKNVSLITQEQNLTDLQIVNIGEVPFSFYFEDNKINMPMPVLTAGRDKLSFTCVLSCAANGDKLKPFLIFRRKKIPDGNYPSDVLITSNEIGSLCENLILDWLCDVWTKREIANFDPRGVLIVDSLHGKLFELTKSKYDKMSISLAVIPEGLRQCLSPLDVSINKIFESEMLKCYDKWLSAGCHSFTKGGKMRKAMPEEIARWVSESWKLVKVSTIVDSFTLTGFLTETDGSTSNIINRSEKTADSQNDKYNEINFKNVETCEHPSVEMSICIASYADESEPEESG